MSSLPRHAAHVNEATTSPHRRAAYPGRVGPGAASGERHVLLPLHARGPIAVSVLCHVSRGAVRGMRGPGTGARGPRAVGGGDEREERLQPPQGPAGHHGGAQEGAAPSPRLLLLPRSDRRILGRTAAAAARCCRTQQPAPWRRHRWVSFLRTDYGPLSIAFDWCQVVLFNSI